MAIEKNLFGVSGGKDVYEYTLSRGNLSVKILNYGGIIRCFNVKTPKSNVDIVLGYDTLKEYENDSSTYFGSIIGRVANRIANAEFTLNGKKYSLYKNDKSNCLHGGKEGFNRKIFAVSEKDEYSLQLEYLSADGEENFPGNLKVTVIYSLTEKGGFKIEYYAQSDADTPICLTNHAYFNLNGEGNGDVLGHVVKFYADRITPVNSEMAPTGEFRNVAGTAFDFSTPKTIGKDINADDDQMKICGGYDINYVKTDKGYGIIAEATGEKSDIKMRVYTSEDGVQFYTGNFLTGQKGKSGAYVKRGAFCLETQAFPNAVNCKEFPSIILKAGEKYQSTTEYEIIV